MADTLVLILTALLALGILGWTISAIWRISRHTPTRQRALTHVLGITAGTMLLGVVLPPVLMGALVPFPIWLVNAVPTVGAAAVLAWRWLALPPGRGRRPGLIITSCVFLAVLAMASTAVT